MQKLFSTNDIDPNDRLTYWMDVCCKNLMAIDSNVAQQHQFNAEIYTVPLAQTVLTAYSTGECEIMRSKNQIAKSDTDDVLVVLLLHGAIHGVVDEHEVAANPGDVWFIDSSRPFKHRYTNVTGLSLKVPRALLEQRMGPVEPLCTRKLSANDTTNILLTTLMRSLPDHAETLDGAAADTITGHALDLLTVGFLGDESSRAATRTHARMASRFRLKSYIETHLFDARLSPPEIAAKAGISTQYANKLLKADNTSLERYVFARRLERSRAILDNPVFDFRSVSEIAHSHGFATPSHFSHRFKEAYGMTPSEYRHRRAQTPRTA